MAELKEIALGIASVLRASPVPEPLPLTFRGQTLEDAAELITLVLAECQDADIPLSRVELDPALWGFLRGRDYLGHVLVSSDPDLSGEARFYRR